MAAEEFREQKSTKNEMGCSEEGEFPIGKRQLNPEILSERKRAKTAPREYFGELAFLGLP